MMAGNPNWWSIMNGMHPQVPQQLSSSTTTYLSPPSHSQYLYGSSPLSSTALADHPNQDFPRSWSQPLMCGLPSDQDRFGTSHCQYNWFQNGEDHHHALDPSSRVPLTDVKQEVAQSSPLYGHVNHEEYQGSRLSRPQVNLVSHPSSCVSNLSTSLLNFSSSKAEGRSQHSDHSTEGNRSSTGGLAKKPRVQQSSTQPALKVRKEKLGDRISTLHQLVSPFGKTDTASVLSEAIGYIRFLLGQIEALSSPYMNDVSKSMGLQHSVQERNCLFAEQPGQFLDNSCLKRREASKQDGQTHPRDLRSRGLCLVPISHAQHMGSDHNGAEFWAPSLGGGF